MKAIRHEILTRHLHVYVNVTPRVTCATCVHVCAYVAAMSPPYVTGHSTHKAFDVTF